MGTPISILTPDAQYTDDGIVERETSGSDVDWFIYRERSVSETRISEDVLKTVDAVVVWHERKVDAAFIDSLTNCKVIVRAGVGFDHIDIRAAGAAGLPVCNTPDYGTSEVADHAIGLMLAFTRGVVTYHEALRRDPLGNYDSTCAPLVRRIRGRVFGVVGLGRIGTATALRAKAFGMRVAVYDPYVSPGTEIAVGVERVNTLNELLAQSDVVSLHTPLTDETLNMIDAVALSKMKRDAILINTARGAIIDIAALLDALDAGTIAGAGIDVLPVEPPSANDLVFAALGPLGRAANDGRLIITPHAAWSSPESRQDARRLSVETAMFYLREGRLRNLVNEPFLLNRRPLDTSLTHN